jgi:D-alanyl-D-alanine carboxypeptidase
MRHQFRRGGTACRGLAGFGRLGQALRAGLLAAAAIAATAIPAAAQIGSHRYAAIVLDNRSGAILAEANADEQRHPASLTKMMTLYIVFEALRDGRLSLDSRVPFSEDAASRPPSKLGIPAGNSISVEQAILALVTRSANDVAAAVGERLGGSEERFAQMMTLRARGLGMTRTTFRNASGLPDYEQVTTARDMATLGRRLMADFPNRYHYFSVGQAQFGGMRIRNHNRMLESYEGVDGIKTGYIRDSASTSSPPPAAAASGWSARSSAAPPGWSATRTWRACWTRASPASASRRATTATSPSWCAPPRPRR